MSEDPGDLVRRVLSERRLLDDAAERTFASWRDDAARRFEREMLAPLRAPSDDLARALEETERALAELRGVALRR